MGILKRSQKCLKIYFLNNASDNMRILINDSANNVVTELDIAVFAVRCYA